MIQKFPNVQVRALGAEADESKSLMTTYRFNGVQLKEYLLPLEFDSSADHFSGWVEPRRALVGAELLSGKGLEAGVGLGEEDGIVASLQEL